MSKILVVSCKMNALTGGLLLLFVLSVSAAGADARPSHKIHPALKKLVVLSALAGKGHSRQLGEIWSDCSKT